MVSSHKRARPAEDEEVEADCMFTIEYPKPGRKTHKTTRHRRSESRSPALIIEPFFQPSPFAPSGKFSIDSGNDMGRHYQVSPAKEWDSMTRYHNFVLNRVKYFTGDFILVANVSTVNQPRNPGQDLQTIEEPRKEWVARILEIRAKDEHHVYARVYWMYRPDELPERLGYNGKRVNGRQPYHGMHELIASNHMDIINVISVIASATVHQWDEGNKGKVQPELYWRQALDVRTMELSSLMERCICKHPENPDKPLIKCSNQNCGACLHGNCVAQKILEDTWQQSGIDGPQSTSTTGSKQEVEDDETSTPLNSDEPTVTSTA